MFQNGFYVSIRQTDKREVSDDVHSLPPDNGPFEEHKVADYPGCPSEWSKDGLFIPVRENQPMWFDFRGNIESACLSSVQKINPATGETADLKGGLSKDPSQNYLKLPDQLWLDGYSKEGKVYQFVVVTEGKGEAVNEILLPKHMQDSHAMGFAFYLPKPRPENVWRRTSSSSRCSMSSMRSKPYEGLTKTVTIPQFSLPGSGGSGMSSGDLVIGAHGDAQRYTQNRVADNYCCNSVEPSYDYDRAANIDSINTALDGDMCMAGGDVSEVDASQMDQASMGAGGRIGQDIIADNNTVEYYQEKPAAILTIYLALPEMFEAITKRGKQQDASRKDVYKTSGHIGGVAVPLV